MVCKGICHRYKAKWGTHQYRYASGQKRCNVCEIFVNWDGKKHRLAPHYGKN